LTLDAGTSAAGLAFTAFMAWTGLVGWVWSIRSIATNARDDLVELKVERERDKTLFNARLVLAERAAANVERLADAVKYSADLTAEQIKNLGEKFGEHAVFTKEQLAEIRHEQKAVRQALAAGTSGRGRAE
jgi:hypothetical protein